jgi:CRP/FNR family cyclic AMP-dependent transcriptional regulator
MASPETLRQYPIFVQLNDDQVKYLIEVSHEQTAEAGQFLFHKGDQLSHFYLVLEGVIEVIFELPKIEVEYTTPGQPGQLRTEYVILSVVGKGDILGWSGLVPPFIATSGGRAKSACRIIAFDCKKLLKCFDQDCNFGYLMIQSAAQVISKRLHDIRKGG